MCDLPPKRTTRPGARTQNTSVREDDDATVWNVTSEQMPPPVIWPTGESLRSGITAKMAVRADSELREVAGGADLADVHGEAVAAYSVHAAKLRGLSAFARHAGLRFRGMATDLGSGTGVGAAILSRMPGFREVLAIDYSETFVRDVMPVTFERFAADTRRIRRVVGDYNRLMLPDGSIDVAIEIGAFHHSETLTMTLREAHRILSHGGILVAIDRAWPDATTDAELRAKLDRQLPSHLKSKYGIEPLVPFSRRDWGEHELRVGEWLEQFRQAGFDAAVLTQQYPRFRGEARLFGAIPTYQVTLRYAAWRYRRGGRRLGVYGHDWLHPVFVCRKP